MSIDISKSVISMTVLRLGIIFISMFASTKLCLLDGYPDTSHSYTCIIVVSLRLKESFSALEPFVKCMC